MKLKGYMLIPIGGMFTEYSFSNFGPQQTQRDYKIFSSPENAEIFKEEMLHKDAKNLVVRQVEIIITL